MEFGRYQVTELLGSGGFGTVFSAYDPQLHRQVAVKVLHPLASRDSRSRERFLREARTLARIQHPNLVPVFDVSEERNRADGSLDLSTPAFFVMSLVEGISLAAMLKPERGLPLQNVQASVTEIAAALDCLHAANITHRDIKPDNIMLTKGNHAIVMDLGIALAAGQARLTLGTPYGSPETAAPEQITGGAVGPAADIYALGVLTYWMLAGRPPFTGSMQDMLDGHKHRTANPLTASRPDLPPRIWPAIERALAKKPQDRFATAGEFAQALALPLSAPASSLPAGTQPLASGPAAVSTVAVRSSSPAPPSGAASPGAPGVSQSPKSASTATAPQRAASPVLPGRHNAAGKPGVTPSAGPWLWFGGGAAAVVVLVVAGLLIARAGSGGAPTQSVPQTATQSVALQPVPTTAVSLPTATPASNARSVLTPVNMPTQASSLPPLTTAPTSPSIPNPPLAGHSTCPPVALLQNQQTASSFTINIVGMYPLVVRFSQTQPSPSGPLNDSRLRQGLALAIDPDVVVLAATANRGDVDNPKANSLVVDNNITRFGDPAEAHRLLMAAGHPDGFSSRLLAGNGALSSQVATSLQQQWRDNLGVNVQLELVEPATLAQRCASGAFEIALDVPN